MDYRKYLTVLMRPDAAFAAIWLLVLAIYSPAIVNFFPEPSTTIFLMVAGSIAIAAGGSFLLERFTPSAVAAPPPTDLVIFSTPFILAVFAVWTAGFALIIAYSGGLPVFWSIEGLDRYYYDYGVPTFSGAWNTLRIVISILATIALVRSSSFRWVLALIIALLTLTVVAEINRGGYVLYCLNVVAAGALVAPSFKRQVAWVAVLAIATLGGIYGIGSVRSIDAKATVAIAAPFEVAQGATDTTNPTAAQPTAVTKAVRDLMEKSAAVSWVYLYLTTPIANLHLAANETLKAAPFPGFYSLYPFLPSVIRPDLLPEDRYPLPLASLAYTMSSGYGTYIADFGFAGASVIMGLQLLLGIWVFKLARYHVWAQILFPMFFAISMLSFFTNYFVTLLTPFHMALAVLLGVIIPRFWSPKQA